MFLAQLPTSAACQNLNNEQAQKHGYLYKEKKIYSRINETNKKAPHCRNDRAKFSLKINVAEYFEKHAIFSV